MKTKGYTIETWKRSSIQLAEYNPRAIDKAAQRRLEKGLQKFGLVSPLVVNRRTGRLVAGHQRITLLDKRANGEDYELEVAVVDLPPKEEKELNVLLNNPAAQGTFDFERLGELFATDPDKPNPFDAGYDMTELELMFGQEMAKEITLMHEPGRSIEENPNEPDSGRTEAERKAYENIKALRKAYAAKQRKRVAAPNNYWMVVFLSVEDRDAFLSALGLPIEQVSSAVDVAEALRYAGAVFEWEPTPPPPVEEVIKHDDEEDEVDEDEE